MQGVCKAAAGCRAGVTISPPASTSGRQCPAGSAACSRRNADDVQRQRRQWRWQQPQRRDWAVGITNTQSELDAVEGRIDPENADYIEVSRLQIPHPELGPLEQRVSATYLDATLSDEISVEDTSYWFTPPEEGWKTEPERIPKAKEVETKTPTAHNPGDGRAALDTVIDGAELTGVVTRMMLYHGAQIDLGTEYDGLIPIQKEEWTEEIVEALFIDTEVTVRVHTVRDPKLYRWPIQLELLSPAHIAEQLPPPEAHRPALDLRGRDDLEQLVKDTGREYRTYKYYAKMAPEPFDCDEDAEPEGTTPQDLWAPSILARISDIACSL